MLQIFSLAAVLLPLLASACDRKPAPMLDRSIERGTALPPPGIEPRPRG